MVPLGNSPTPTGLYVHLELTWLFKIGEYILIVPELKALPCRTLWPMQFAGCYDCSFQFQKL